MSGLWRVRSCWLACVCVGPRLHDHCAVTEVSLYVSDHTSVQ